MEFVADGDSIATAVLGALSHEDKGVRARAIEDAARFVDPDDLIEAVADHANARRRNAALDALARGAIRSVPSLVRALDHDDPEVVMLAASALGKTRDKTAVPHLVKLLEREDVNIVQAALDSLSHLRASVAVAPIVALLERDPWMRLAAVHALGEIGDPSASEALIPLLDEEDTRDLAIEAIGKLRAPDALAPLGRILRGAEEADTCLSCLRAIGAILEPAAWGAPQKVSELAEALSSLEASRVHVRLLAVLSGEEGEAVVGVDARETKIAATTLIRTLRIQSLYTPMVLAGRDPALLGALRFAAVSVGTEIAESLRIAVAYHDPYVRILACCCAADLRLESLGPRIRELVADEVAEVREAAARALAFVGDGTSSAPDLAPLLLDEAEVVREAAQHTLGVLERRAVTAALIDYGAQGPDARVAALEVMAATPHADQIPFIEESLGSAHAAARVRAIEALAAQPGYDLSSAAEALLEDPDAGAREAALRGLATRRTDKSRDLIVRHMARDPDTRAAAVRAAADLGDPAIGPRLIEQFWEESRDTRLAVLDALAQLREPAAEPLLAELTGHGDEEVRIQAVRALAAFGGDMPLRYLRATAQDPSPRVREAVAEVLSSRTLDEVWGDLERLALDDEAAVARVARHRLEAGE